MIYKTISRKKSGITIYFISATITFPNAAAILHIIAPKPTKKTNIKNNVILANLSKI